jgi:hypothetical protein
MKFSPENVGPSSTAAVGNGSWPDRFLDTLLPSRVAKEIEAAEAHIRQGRFQRSLSALAGASPRVGGCGGRLRTLSGQLRSTDHVHARRAWRRDDDCRNLRSIQPARGADAPSLDFRDHVN